MTEGDFHLSSCARSFSSYRSSWEKSWMFCENWHLVSAVSESALSMSCSPLLSAKSRVFLSSFICGRVFVSRFVWEWYSPHDWETSIYRAVQGVLARIDFLGRNRECLVRTVPAPETYCVAQSCRVCVACSSCTVIFSVFFLRIMIREYHACFSTLCLKMGA